MVLPCAYMLSLADLELPNGVPAIVQGTVLGVTDLLEGCGSNPVRNNGTLVPVEKGLDDIHQFTLLPHVNAVFRSGT